MITSRSFDRRLALALAAALAGTALFLAGFWAGSARGDAEASPSRSASQAVPAWFGPIWDYYDRNPRITPEFDFAALYAGEAPPLGVGRADTATMGRPTHTP